MNNKLNRFFIVVMVLTVLLVSACNRDEDVNPDVSVGVNDLGVTNEVLAGSCLSAYPHMGDPEEVNFDEENSRAVCTYESAVLNAPLTQLGDSIVSDGVGGGADPETGATSQPNTDTVEDNVDVFTPTPIPVNVSSDLQAATDSLLWPGLTNTAVENAGDPNLRFDDSGAMENRVWVSENNEACSAWVSSYTVLSGDPDQYLRDCTEWQVPPGATFNLGFVAETGVYWHNDLNMLVVHNPVLAARQEGQSGRLPMPWLAITPVDGISIDVLYGDGTVCVGAATAVIVADMDMYVSFTNTSSIHAKIGIGPGGDPNSDVDLLEWTIGNDVPLPTCHPESWFPGQ